MQKKRGAAAVLIAALMILTGLFAAQAMDDGRGVVYEGNGGTTAAGTATYELPGGTAAASQFQRDGYTWLCWNTAADGSGRSVTTGDAVRSGTVLYACWCGAANPILIHYLLRDDTVMGVSAYLKSTGETIHNGSAISVTDTICLRVQGSASGHLVYQYDHYYLFEVSMNFKTYMVVVEFAGDGYVMGVGYEGGIGSLYVMSGGTVILNVYAHNR